MSDGVFVELVMGFVVDVAGRVDVDPLGVTKTTLVMGESAEVVVEIEVVVVETFDVGDEVAERLVVEERVLLLVVGGALLVVVLRLVVADVIGEERLDVVVGVGIDVDGLVEGLVVGESLVVGCVDAVGKSADVVEGAAASVEISELVNVLVTVTIGVEVTIIVAVVVDGVSSRDEMMLEPLLNVCAVAPANMADVMANCLQIMVPDCDVMLVCRKIFRQPRYVLNRARVTRSANKNQA
jgi:hypothetical protein